MTAVGMPGHGLGDAKALMAQFGQVFGRGTVLGVADLRHAPDAIGQSDEAILLLVDVPPNCVAVIHRVILQFARRRA